MKDLSPPSSHLQNVKNLCELQTPYESNQKLDSLFITAFKEILLWHQKNNSFYKNLLKNFDIESLNSIHDLQKVPFIHANFFKMHETVSISKDKIFEHLTSSGTSGQKSQMFFDEWSILSARRMVEFIYGSIGFNTPKEESNYLLLAYEPLKNFKVGTTNTNIFLTSFSKPKEIFFALRQSGGVHEFDKFGTVRKLQEYAKQDLPVRIHGFPSFMYFTLMQMKEMDIKLKLHPNSLVMFGGGWKGYANKQIPKNELFELINEFEMLTVPLNTLSLI
jgi:phenylacetate-coenzyme A ligase PaaK-like adenylate-forming protein